MEEELPDDAPAFSCTPFDPLVDTETEDGAAELNRETPRCTPFDPLVDTETFLLAQSSRVPFEVAPPSIRLWILKR